MRPIVFKGANKVYELPEDMEGYDLPTFSSHDDDDNPTITSIWEMEAEEMAAIASGKIYVAITINGTIHPPISMALINEKMVKR